MFEDYDAYEVYENDLEEMGRNEAFHDFLYENDSLHENEDDYWEYGGIHAEDEFLDSFFE